MTLCMVHQLNVFLGIVVKFKTSLFKQPKKTMSMKLKRHAINKQSIRVKLTLEVEPKLHLFDTLIKRILLYDVRCGAMKMWKN